MIKENLYKFISIFLIILAISSYFIGFLYGENSAGAGTFSGDFVFLWRNLQTFVNNDLNIYSLLIIYVPQLNYQIQGTFLYL